MENRVTDNAPQQHAVYGDIEYTPTEQQMFEMWLEKNIEYFEDYRSDEDYD